MGTRLSVVLLAGGFGTRLQEIAKGVPKPIVQLSSGETAIESLMTSLVEASMPLEFVVCVGHGAEQIMKKLGDNHLGTPIVYSLEDEPLGTGGAVLNALPKIKTEQFLKLNTDTFFDFRQIAKVVPNVREQVAFISSHTDSNDQFDGLVQGDEKVQLIDRRANPNNAILGAYFLKKATFCNVAVEKCSLENLLFETLEAEMLLYDIACKFLDIGTVEGYAAYGEFNAK